MHRRPLQFALGFAVLVAAVEVFSAEITAQRSENGAVVKIDGRLFAEYCVRSGTKPILWPIIGPTGKPVTRDFPMAERAGEAKDHPHHRSLWFTHGDVGGEDFWAEPPHGGGVIQHLRFLEVSSGKPAVVATENAWIARDGRKLCEDRRLLRFDAEGDARWIDFDVTLVGGEAAVRFGDTKEGTFGIRVAQSMSVDAQKGGRIVNSLGHRDAAAWGRAAPWIDYHGPIDGRTVGIAVFNHPSSFRYPAFWHVRTYGLLAANPFGSRSLTAGRAPDGSFTLGAGGRVTFRYRVFLHCGDEREGKVAEAFAAYRDEVK